MANTITYNGLTISNVELRSVVHEAQYDEGDQGVSHQKTILTIAGTISADDNGSLVAYMSDHRQKLLTPRANLVVNLAGNDLYNITAPDDLGGPKPRRCEITNIIGSQFAVVVWEVEINKTECVSTNDSPSNIISHRWTCTHAIDELQLTTLTLRGSIRVRDAASSNNPDALRGLVTPKIPDGFRRKSASFVVTTDGLRLEYEIVDEEVYLTPPIPAVKWRGHFAHKSNDGYLWFNICEVELEGTKPTPKIDLFNSAFAIINSRIDLTKEFILDATIYEELGANLVRVSFMTRFVGSVPNTPKYPQPSPLFKPVPGTDTNKSPDLGPYGSAMIAAAKQEFYLPCVGTINPQGEQNKSGDSTGTTISVAPAPSSSLDTGGQTDLSAKQLDNPYITYERNLDYQQQNGIVILPSAAPSTPAIIYQIHNPWVLLIDEGYATRYNVPPDIPVPIYRDTGIIRHRNIKPGGYKLAADKKTKIFSLNWRIETLVPCGGGKDNFRTINNWTDLDSGPFNIPTNEAVNLWSDMMIPNLGYAIDNSSVP